jgi:phosphoribosylanthranilate isomerase
MTGPAIKICGIRTPEALEAAISARANHAGFVFFPASPRHVTMSEARALGERAQGRITRVGLFVEPEDAMLAEAVATGSLDAIQLHGQESPERSAQLRARYGLPIWKALAVSTAQDVARANTYDQAADVILFDAKTPKGTLPGGMGLSFDWSLISGWKGPLPWGLAGGLTSENIADAVAITGAPLVDTSTGVESAPGVKDVDKIAAFCKAARAS